MAANNDATDRHVVPRWRSFREAVSTGELAVSELTGTRAVDGSEFVKEKEAAWAESKSMPFAVELVSAATILGATPLAIKAAEHVLENGAKASEVAQRLARALLGKERAESLTAPRESRMQVVRAIKDLKAKRTNQPRNAFVWVDLAGLYVLLGQQVAARQALKIALALAPTDRFVLRCTARFLHHIKEFDEAVQLLRRNGRTPSDAWLVAAEIAASGVLKKTPKFAKVGSLLLNNSNIHPFHTSELASALASLELDAGKHRAANKLFNQSLRQPTDNSLAQIVWASGRTGMATINADVLEKTGAVEALTWNDFHHERWENVIVHSEKWAREEAFSARPLLLASSAAASFLDKPLLAEAIARRGLEANPGDPALINNVAFAMALDGRPREALKIIEHAAKSAMRVQDAICLLATTGLAYFRAGNLTEGRKYYDLAISSALGPENEVLKLAASLYLGREMALAGDKEGVTEFKKAYDEAQKLKRTHIPALALHLAEDVEKAAGSLGVQTKISRKKAKVALADGPVGTLTLGISDR